MIMSAGYSTGSPGRASSPLISTALAAEPAYEMVPVVVERHAHGDDPRHEQDGVDILLLGDVRAEIRRDPRAGDAAERRDEGEQPERHGTDPEQIGDDVLREARH